MSTLTTSGKALGSRRPLFADWSIPFLPQWRDEGGLTLRDLIARVVRGSHDDTIELIPQPIQALLWQS